MGSYYQSSGSEDAPGFSTPQGVREREGLSSHALFRRALAAVACLGALSATAMLSMSGSDVGKSTAEFVAHYGKQDAFDAQGRFVMRDFDKARPFSSFLPGLGGLFGLPMWAFYVNRGQAMAAFGTENKQHPIMEFFPANKAYPSTSDTGFRTFLRLSRGWWGSETSIYQPFYPRSDASEEDGIQRDLLVGKNELEIVEKNSNINLKTTVNYFTVPDDDFAALVRSTSFTNTDEYQTLALEALDGLTRVQPFGVSDWHLKNMGRTLEGWFEAFNFDESDGKLPFFKLTASIADSEEVTMVNEGNWVVSFIDTPGEVMDGTLNEALSFIADPALVFGQLDSALKSPLGFETHSLEELLSMDQVTLARTPCAFAAASIVIPPKGTVTITSVYGRAKTMETFTDEIAPKVLQKGFIASKRNIAIQLTNELTAPVETSTANHIFDETIKQSYLDNLLRGGFPIILGEDTDETSSKVYHTFNRIHGDLERDYNNFQLDLTYFSQGPGNFRDVNQNRRKDVSLNPDVRDFNVRTFLTFIQADGYNPLTVATAQFVMDSEKVGTVLQEISSKGFLDASDEATVDALTGLLNRPFRPGNLFADIATQGIQIGMENLDFINLVAGHSRQVPQANMTVNGVWADHWTYTLDLVEDFLSVFPDEEEWVLYDSEPVPFFFSIISVQPRAKKYVVAKPGAVRQYGCAFWDGVKIKYQQMHETDPDAIWLRVGELPEDFDEIEDNLADNVSDIFTVSPIVKLLVLAVNKFSLLDPEGMGVEMDGGKPGWNDAMNGLPGMIGSGMPETFELLRLLRFLKSVQKYDRSVDLPAELDTLIRSILDALQDDSMDNFTYWDTVATAREDYRHATNRLISGELVSWSQDQVVDMLEKFVDRVEMGIQKAIDISDGKTPTYFYYSATDYEIVKDEAGVVQHDAVNRPNARVLAFEVKQVPLFLEGPVRRFKTLKEREDKIELYNMVKSSGIYDQKLKLYKICESLEGMSFELGRMLAFAPGWLENESVWLHMSYKYYLELIRAGLFDEFWNEAKTGLTSFMDPVTFDRSPLEAASFIVSSAYPDERLHGSGFLARLSGSTAELLSMWTLMFQGPKPFILNEDGELNLHFQPALPGWLFSKSGVATFTFLGSVKVSIINPSGENTWELGDLSSALITHLDGTQEVVALTHGVLPAPYAAQVRSRQMGSLELTYE